MHGRQPSFHDQVIHALPGRALPSAVAPFASPQEHKTSSLLVAAWISSSSSMYQVLFSWLALVLFVLYGGGGL